MNKYIPPSIVTDVYERQRIERCQEWWAEINQQLARQDARVYVPDICIAETFKTLSKKYFEEHWFSTPNELANAKRQLRKDIVIPPKKLSSFNRDIKFHDIPTSRDIIIAVDRFFELFQKHHLSVSLPDLIIVATAKYMMDFFDIPKERLHIITLDGNLWTGTKRITEIPRAYNPTQDSDVRSRIFR
ncbi:MAG: hypothetical protein WCC00_04285 [Candidatus Aminicenantales bacterium]